jgi:SRSO17 transposase
MSDPITVSEQRLQEYLSHLTAMLGHADRKARLVSYCTGLLLPGERKSVEPMAARLDPAQVPSLHQALHHFVATAAWRAMKPCSPPSVSRCCRPHPAWPG